MNWKSDHAKKCDAAVEHNLVENVIEEFMGNIGLADTGLPAYGIRKVAMYAAQVARAQALGFDPELLRMNHTEATEVQMKLAAHATRSGIPVTIVVDGP